MPAEYKEYKFIFNDNQMVIKILKNNNIWIWKSENHNCIITYYQHSSYTTLLNIPTDNLILNFIINQYF